MDATRSTVRRRKPALGQALQGAGFEVVAYDNGLSAYQRLREEPFELLLTDIVMPEMDGIELARRASELDPGIKIMFITGFAAVALNSDSAAPKEKHVVSMTDPMGALVSFQQALLDGEIRLRPAALDPELFVFADNPAPGVRRIRYVRLDGSTVTAFVNVANAGFRDGLHACSWAS